MKKPKTRASGKMTEGQYNSFIRSLLRRGSQRWPPISETLKKARRARGIYECGICKQEVPVSIVVDGKRRKNVAVDHRNPVVTTEGFVDWKVFIENLFCEEDNLQVACSECHNKKTEQEREARSNNKNKEENT